MNGGLFGRKKSKNAEKDAAEDAAALKNAPVPGSAPDAVRAKRRVVVVQVRVEKNGCGYAWAKAECGPTATADEIMDLVMGPRGIDAFYKTLSRGRISFSLDPKDILQVVLPLSTSNNPNPDYLDFPSLIESKLGNLKGDHNIIMLPLNYFRPEKKGKFGFGPGCRMDGPNGEPNDEENCPSTAAIGLTGGKVVWVREPVRSNLIHELGHNLRLGHAGANTADGYKDYFDITSAMSLTGEEDSRVLRRSWNVGGWRGLSAAQMFRTGMLDASQILDIRSDGTYSIPNSLSALDSGISAARIYTSPTNRPLWIEWREAKNADIDFVSPNFAAFFANLKIENAKGTVLESILVKEMIDRRRTSLLGLLKPGTSATIHGVTIACTGRGAFSVSGIGSAAANSFVAPPPPAFVCKVTAREADNMVCVKDQVFEQKPLTANNQIDPNYSAVYTDAGIGFVRNEWVKPFVDLQ